MMRRHVLLTVTLLSLSCGNAADVAKLAPAVAKLSPAGADRSPAHDAWRGDGYDESADFRRAGAGG